MTTMYRSEEEAITEACRLAGVPRSNADGIVPEEETVFQIGSYRVVNKYTIKNKFGEPAAFGIGPLREGFELWLFGPNGEAIRT